jgi:hypothetical protein
VTPSNESSTSIGFKCSSDITETLGEALSILPAAKLQTNDILLSQWPYSSSFSYSNVVKLVANSQITEVIKMKCSSPATNFTTSHDEVSLTEVSLFTFFFGLRFLSPRFSFILGFSFFKTYTVWVGTGVYGILCFGRYSLRVKPQSLIRSIR